MNIIIFLIILALLVLVHEFGHFIVAKRAGIRVDEFGLGFPPRIFGKKIGETMYSLNIVPFGGFVKIFGENAESLELPDGTRENESRSLAYKNRAVQAAVIGAGVSFNIIFAWLVISLGLVFGLPTAVDTTGISRVSNVQTIVSSVLPQSPAERAGIKPGDILLGIKSETAEERENITPERIRSFISKSTGELTLSYKRGSKVLETKVSPQAGIVEGAPAVGISMDMVGILKLPIRKAFIEGAVRTVQLFKNVTVSIFYFFHDAFLGHANLTEVAGPVGMVALVGDARELGFAYLIFFTALLSINLAVINLIPFPALDGGRLLMIVIEAVTRSPIRPKIVQSLNTVGFILLILLMLAVTYHDILKLF